MPGTSDVEEAVQFGKLVVENPPLNQFYLDLFRTINQYRPTTPPSNQDKLVFKKKCTLDKPVGVHDSSDESLTKLSYMTLDYCFHLSPSQTGNLRTAHKGFISRITELFGEPQLDLQETLMPGQKGIVTVASDRSILSLIASIPELRAAGSKLPIEVIFGPYTQREDQFCERFLPSYNARCVYMADVLPEYVIKAYDFDEKMVKAFTPLVSDFQNILYIDANHFAGGNVDTLFLSDLYLKNGLVLWPGQYRKTISPAFYQIANRKVDLNNRTRNLNDDVSSPSRYMDMTSSETQFQLLARTPMHDLAGSIPDPATHIGLYMLDKRRHFKTLLLSLYYRTNGATWYDKMFASEDPKRGYCDNLVAAAHALGKPYHLIHQLPRTKGGAVSHVDPVVDQGMYVKLLERIENGGIDVESFDPMYEPIITFEKMMKNSGSTVSKVAFTELPMNQFDLLSLHLRAKSNEYDSEQGHRFKHLHNVLCAQGLKIQYIEETPSKYNSAQMCSYLKKLIS